MLIEVGIMFATYMGARLREKTAQKYRQQSEEVEPKQRPAKSSQTLQKATVSEATKYYQHHTKISVVSIGLSAIRQFIYPPIALLSFGLFLYTSIPYMKLVEKALLMDKKINADVLYFIAGVITLAISQYFTVAVGVWLTYYSLQTVAQAKNNSEKMLIDVFEQQPRKVWILKDNVEIEIPLEEVKVNDILVANTGEVVPVDGIITEGVATIDQHALTGESQPVEKEVGDQVFASTIVVSGRILVKIEKSGQETTIAKIGKLLNQSSDFKSNLQLKGEKWADMATLPTLGIAGLILPIFGPVTTVVFLSSHIGNRIRIYAPLGTLNYLGLAAHKGILVKDGRALEELIQVDTVLFDKTGTLTNEQPEVGQIIVCDNYGTDEILTYAAAAERKFTHPLAKAIVQKAEESDLTLPDIEDSQYQIGYGVIVNIGNEVIRVGSHRFMIQEGITIPEMIEQAQAKVHAEGHSLVLVAVNHQIGGAVEIQPQVRPEVKQIISGLRQRGIKQIAIVSGDHKQPTQKLAADLDLDSYFYDILPENKAQIVEQLQKEGKSVCFVGDGINDAIAMQKANVSISLRGATSIATDVAEIVLMDGSLSHLCELFDISKNLEANLQKSLLLSIVPGAINLSGAFLLHFQILTALLVNNVFVFVGISNAMRPLKEISDEKTDS